MVVFNDPVPVENPALQAVLMALEVRDAIGALTATWSRLGHEIGFVIGIRTGLQRSAPSASRDALTTQLSVQYRMLRLGFVTKPSRDKSSSVLE